MSTNQKPVSRYLSLLSLLTIFASEPRLQVKSLTVQRLHPIKRRFLAKSGRAGYDPSTPVQGIRSGTRTGFLLRAEDGGDGGSDSSENEKKKLPTGRIGGREYSKRKNSNDSMDSFDYSLSFTLRYVYVFQQNDVKQ
jgi:hypothetical protein